MKHIFALCVTLLVFNVIPAQEIIEDKKEETPVSKSTDSVNTFEAKKIDGVAAVVGEYILLDSDMPKERAQILAAGGSVEGVTDCQLMGVLLERKLYAHHAVQDSINVPNAEIRQQVEYTIQQFLQSVNGSMEKLLELHKKEDEESYREEIFEIIKSNELAKRMQAKVVEEVEVTPEEVRTFFNKIPKDERPTFGTELKVAQIVAEPKVSEEEKQKVIDRLKQFKADVVENGASFRSKVVLYGQDPGMKQSGYTYTLNRKRPQMAKEFREVAFSLQEGEISDPFETEFGFHIIYLQKIRGQEYDVSHVLLFPKVSDDAIKEAKERLDKARQRIVDGDISFADAAREVSDSKETKGDGGQLINPQTQDYNFELTRMDTELYGQIQSLKDNEVSMVLSQKDRNGNVSFKLLMVSDRVEDHEADYAKDYLKIKESALNEKKIKTIEKWQAEKILDTYIKIGESYKGCEFSSNWLKK